MVAQEKMSIESLINDYNSKILSYPIQDLPSGFIQGKLGVLYYLMYVYLDTQKVVYFDKITDILMDVFNTIQHPDQNDLLNDSSFAEGISGLGFVISELINNDLLDEEYGEQIPILSQIAFEYANKKLEQNNYDFLHGSIGVLIFLLKIKNQDLFDQLVNKLLKKSKESVLLFSTQSDDPYISDINFGFPHGYLSTIKLLLDAKTIFGTNKMYDTVIDLCVSKIKKHIDKSYEVDGIHIYKPHKVYIDNGKLIEHQNNRLAWCNSDLSWVFLLSKIDSVNNTSKHNQIIDEIGNHLVVRREMKVTGVENHHFCHGSSGIAQLFGELYEYTKDKKYQEAYNYWTQRTVNYLKEELFNDLTERDMSLYYGKIGALLTLYSYHKEFPHGWKEAFLIN
jgi:lantibiotic modifying enzyme